MARCPHCNKILSDEWVKSAGAQLMGKTGGKAKRRSTSGKPAADARWARRRKEKNLQKQTDGR